MEENLRQQPSTIIKIAFYGPESTGKTTLAKQLAQHFNTVWASEYARDYLQEKWNLKHEICQIDDLLPIAIGQIKLENEALKKANQYLFCDTNLMVTKVFSEIHYSSCNLILDKAARTHEYDLFLLTNVDVPWIKDDLRDKPENRKETFEIFKQALIDNKKPFLILSGNEKERLTKAISIIESLSEAKKIGFSSHDFVQIYEQEIHLNQIKNQLEIFKNGIPKIILNRPATKNDGIAVLTENEIQEFITIFDATKNNLKITKFVPASGAASRMFGFLNTFLNDFDPKNETINAYINRTNSTELAIFIVGMDKLPFFKTVDRRLRTLYPDFENWSRDDKNFHFIQLLLSKNEFDFANKPKAIIPFHDYKTHLATPIEEHLFECVHYAESNKNAHLHFTISEEHQPEFEKIIEIEKPKYEAKFDIKIKVDFSYQNKKSDTLAVDTNNNLHRDENNKLRFRQAGHGALIENLNNLDADLVFVKNIDNVILNQIETISSYKKTLAGKLIALQKQIFDYLYFIENEEDSSEKLNSIITFAKNNLNINFDENFGKLDFKDKKYHLFSAINKPIRVCGMVKNEGEPGGGPFWVEDSSGNCSLQIVEASQVAIENQLQQSVLKTATHFNPVDLVCGIKNYKGQKFDLQDYIDEKTGFIVTKNDKGKPIKGYELPGLWNGAMAKWITVFVEVPLITFNPVKTVNDLLKATHQAQ